MSAPKDITKNDELFPPLLAATETWTLVDTDLDLKTPVITTIATIATTELEQEEGWQKIETSSSPKKLDYALVASRAVISTPELPPSSSTTRHQACPSCEFDNHADLVECEMCGTRLRDPGADTINMPTADPLVAGSGSQLKCDSCTFLNHWALSNCEICGAILDPKPPARSSSKRSGNDLDELDYSESLSDPTAKHLREPFRDIILRQ